jgi:hypothetical protein
MSSNKKQNSFNAVYRKMIVSLDQSITDAKQGHSVASQAEIIDRMLDKGMVFSNPEEVDDFESNVFVFAGVETFLKYHESAQSEVSFDVYAGTETYMKLTKSIKDHTRRERESFLPAISNIVDLTEGDRRLLDKGVVESGDYSLLNRFFIKLLPTWIGGRAVAAEAATRQEHRIMKYDEILDRMLDKGIVFSINKSEITISSVETYLKFAEATQDKIVDKPKKG